MTSEAKPVTEMTPVEIDTVLSKLWEKMAGVQRSIEYGKERLESLRSRGRPTESTENALEEARNQLKALQAQAQPYNDEFVRRGRWKRYYLVQNGNGHVHREMHCPTCFPTTVYGWLIELADCNEEEMVKTWGERACTVCFPDAPSMAKILLEKYGPCKVEKVTAEKKAAREARRAEVAAKKAAKAINNPDGSPLKSRYGWRLDTVSKAKQEFNNAAHQIVKPLDNRFPDYESKNREAKEDFEKIAAALAAKLGKNAEDLKKEALKKAEKELKRGW